MKTAESFLIAAFGTTRGALAQCFATDAAAACAAVRALCLDAFGEDVETKCIDREAAPGLWIEGDPSYIRDTVQ